jgi:hypothetical protein
LQTALFLTTSSDGDSSTKRGNDEIPSMFKSLLEEFNRIYGMPNLTARYGSVRNASRDRDDGFVGRVGVDDEGSGQIDGT